MKKKTLVLLVGACVLIGMILSLGIAEMVHLTGTDKFCVSCHTMQPMANAFHNDVHGGNNPQGFKADCVACHVSHENTFMYLWTKALTSANDVYKTVFTDADKIDWQEKRKERNHFVYESGCLSCHRNLKEQNNQVDKAWLAHRDYFAGITGKTCVQCHENVGHKNMGIEITKYWDKYNRENNKTK